MSSNLRLSHFWIDEEDYLPTPSIHKQELITRKRDKVSREENILPRILLEDEGEK